MRRALTATAALMAALLAPCAASALNACGIDAATMPPFGTYDPTGSSDDLQVGSVAIDCTLPEYVPVLLSAASGTVLARKLQGPGAGTIAYQLYSDAGRTLPWPGAFGEGAIPAVPAPGGLIDGVKPIYGRIKAGIDVPVGTYTDTITVEAIF